MARRKDRVEDPSIHDCALALVEETRAAIEAAYLAEHIPHWMIRERILFAAVPGWIRNYGKPCADMAVRALLSMDLEMILTRSGRRAERQWWAGQMREGLKHRKRNSWINRLAISLCGLPLYGLALGLGSLVAAPPAEARGRERHDHLQACAAAREADRHAMGCWRFSPSEIAISRPWDDPPARNGWDNKRPWENDDDE